MGVASVSSARVSLSPDVITEAQPQLSPSGGIEADCRRKADPERRLSSVCGLRLKRGRLHPLQSKHIWQLVSAHRGFQLQHE